MEKNNIPQTMPQPTQTVTTRSRGFDVTNPERMAAALKACEIFSRSMLVPEMYRAGGVVKQGEDPNSPAVTMTPEQAQANVFIALDMAGRMGVNPLMVMQNLYPIKGKPSWSSSFLIATVNTCGRFRPLKFFLSTSKDIKGNPEVIEDQYHNKMFNTTCVAYTSPIDVPEDKIQENTLYSTTISLKMAMDEGWYYKKGSKWRTMPEQMLRYRAAAFWVRTYAPEISMGMYTADEREDIEDGTFMEVTDFSQANKGEELAIDIPGVKKEEGEAKEAAQTQENAPQQTSASQVMNDAAEQSEGSWRNRRGTDEAPEADGPGF